jgi:WhiB family redox-sensing transcriptional regulator
VLADRPWADALPPELEELLERRAWQAEAACLGMGSALFFPEPTDDQTVAKSICAGCLVPAECLAFGLKEGEGIWGGQNGRDRRKLRTAGGGSAAQTGQPIASYPLLPFSRETAAQGPY